MRPADMEAGTFCARLCNLTPEQLALFIAVMAGIKPKPPAK